MDSSSHIRPKKPLLVIGSMINSGSSHPKPSGYSSEPKRDSRNYDDRRSNNLPLKKSRTIVDSNNGNKTVVVEPDTPKLSRQYWKAGDDNEDEHVPYCRNDAKVKVNPQFLHANATSHKCALGALVEVLDNSLDEDVTPSRYVDRIPDMGLENGKHRHGISFSESVSGNEAGELQKVKEESAKHVAKLQRQKGQLESQLKESKCKIQDFEKRHKLKDDSEKLVAVLINQLKQSTAKIKDLEKMQNVNDDESAKQVAELQRQKALLKEESKKVKDESTKQVAELQRQKALLKEESKKVKDESTKQVAELQRQKELLEIESDKLKQSEAKNQDLEYKLKNAAEDFFQERAHRDSTEHNLKNKLREAFSTIHTLTSKVNRLESEKR
ncbi:hypothetical protein HID58_004285 [Brassica napus]|uniref:Uncharacterized protein n=1 Tax=Brassica napus TaxID=3708 RepID=A0ABQ8E5D2_BRANA|nr:hypothetical protein HID58_004285 [Brassica napus]